MTDEPDFDLRSSGSAQLERLESPGADGPPPVDHWLERRLRVFERALAQLEARQEKAEQELRRRLALLEEAVFALQAKSHDDSSGADAKAGVASAEEIVPPEPASGEGHAGMQRDMHDFVAEARKLAQSSMIRTCTVPPPVKGKGAPRWMAWSAVGCASAMVVTALALGTVAGASVPPQAGGISHRQIAHEAFPRAIALADSGDARGETRLAFAYLRGEHAAADHAAAARWALAAAKEGAPMAQYLIGALYRTGDGVAPDLHQASIWFEAAALGGNLKAMHSLAVAYAEGQGVAHDPARAAAWFNRAAEEGYTDSQFDLAVFYERGDGVKQNPVAALKWYLIAARSGDRQADVRARQLAAEMPIADVARAESLAGSFAVASADPAANTL